MSEDNRLRKELLRIKQLASDAYSFFMDDIRQAQDWPTTQQRMQVAHKLLEIEQVAEGALAEGEQKP